MAIDFKKLVKGLFIKDSSDPSKGLKLEIDPTAATNTTTTILAEQQANVLLSLPGENSELVGDIASQTLENKTIDAANNTIVGITDAEISATAGVDVTKLADGSVDNTEFQHLNGVSSNIQTQLTINANDINGHITNPSGAHAASAISNTPSGNLSATDLQAAVNELQSDIDTRALASNLTAHITDTTDAHLASAIGYSGNANSTVEGALDNLYTYKLTVGSSQQLVSDLNANSNKITALATPVSGTDAANKNYVDGIAAGLDPKESVRVATTTTVGGSYATTPSNGRFTGAATTIDGVTLSANDRVLIKDQADAKQNGIYVYDGAGQFTRSADMDGSPSSEVSGGNFVFVAQGTTNGASGFVLVASGIVTLNTDNLNFTQFSGGANSANKTLSNLDAPTSINQDLIPDAANSRNLGSTTNNFFDGYITRLKDPSNVVSFHTENRQLLDSSGVSSVTFSSPTEVSFNNKKLNLIGSAAGLAYATNKQNVQEYIKNLIPDGDAEGANIISVYNDSSTTRPVDGTGGTQANLAATITSTNPLSGTNSFLLTKSGSVSTQGSGFSIPFTVPIGQQAKVLQIDIDYIVNSGTFAAGSSSAESDMIVYLYDVTNNTLIEPSSIKFLSNSSTISDKFTTNFQTSATGTSYRLILHCQSTSTANYALKCEFSVKPCQYVYGTPITDWVSYTPTLSNLGTTTNVNGAYRRVGSNLEGKVTFTAGTGTGSTATIGLPSGLAMPSAPAGFRASVNNIVGDVANGGAGSGVDIVVLANPTSSTTTLTIGIRVAATLDNLTSRAGSDLSSTYFDLRFSVPISGWSSSTQVSDGYDGREISFSAEGVTSNAVGANTVVSYNTVTIDKTNSYNTTTDVWTAPTSGTYEIYAQHRIITTGVATVNQFAGLLIQVDSVTKREYYNYVQNTGISSWYVNGSYLVNLTAGQGVRILADTNITNPQLSTDTTQSYVQIKKLQAPTTISATEVVAATYQTDAAQSLTSAAVLKFEDKVFDTHNAYNTTTGVYTAPVQGLYAVSFSTFTIDTTTGQDFEIAIRKNSSNVARFHSGHYLTNRYSAAGTFIVSLLAGETIDIYNTSSFAAGTLYSSGQDNFFSIQRIK